MPPALNKGICCSRSARSLFSMTFDAGASILIGSRLARRSVSTLRTSSRSVRKARVRLHSLASTFLLLNFASNANTPAPIQSITANHDKPVAKVIDNRKTVSKNKFPPKPPNSIFMLLPTKAPIKPPDWAGKSGAGPPIKWHKPVALIKNPTIPNKRNAGPKSTWPSPSLSMPYNAIHAMPASTNGMLYAT